tara:strand:- start:296 stop:433 length:138 start_codon:yes stop_codon:yes gene_type:complete
MSEDSVGCYFCVGIFSIVFLPKVSADFCSADVTDFVANEVSSFDV